MSKLQISASVDLATVNAIVKKANDESRSFSQMVDMLLQDAIKKSKPSPVSKDHSKY